MKKKRKIKNYGPYKPAMVRKILELAEEPGIAAFSDKESFMKWLKDIKEEKND